jgi:hypothetical protein
MVVLPNGPIGGSTVIAMRPIRRTGATVGGTTINVGKSPRAERTKIVGHWFAQWIAAPGIDPTAIQPGNAELIDKTSYAAMRALRRPFVTVHEIAFYALIILIALHIVGATPRPEPQSTLA